MTTRTLDQVCQRIAELDKRFRRRVPGWSGGDLESTDTPVWEWTPNVTLDTLAQYAPFGVATYEPRAGSWEVSMHDTDDSEAGSTLLDAWARAYLAKLEAGK